MSPSKTFVRNITAKDRAIATKIQLLFDRRKNEWPNFNQTTFAEMIGISQPAINQYMKGKLQFNTDILMAIAKSLECQPTELDPQFFTERPLFRKISKHRVVPILGTTSGKRTKETQVLVADTELPDSVYAVDVDTDEYGDALPKGSKVIVDPLGKVIANRKVAIWFVGKSHTKIFYFIKSDSKKSYCRNYRR